MRVIVVILGLLGLLAAVGGAPAAAQTTIGMTKEICSGTPNPGNPSACVTPPGRVISFGVPVYYLVTLQAPATGGLWTMTLAEQPAVGFTAGTVQCWIAGGGSQLTVTGMSFQVAAGQTAVCTVPGTYNSNIATTDASDGINVTAHDAHEGSATGYAHVSATVASKVIPTDISLTKTVSSTQIAAGTVVTYTIVVANTSSGAQDVVLGPLFELTDKFNLTAGSVMLQTQLQGTPTCVATGGSDCLDVTPSNGNAAINIGSSWPTVFQTWTYGSSPGVLHAGTTMTLTYSVLISTPSSVLCGNGTDGLHNTAFFDLQRQGGTTITETDPNNNTAVSPDVHVDTGITTACVPNPDNANVQVLKTQVSPANPVTWPGPVQYKIVVTNTSTTATATNVKLWDLVSQLSGTPNFKVTTVSATCVNSGSGGPCNGVVMGPNQLTGWGASATVWGNLAATTRPTLGPGDAITIMMTLQYDLTSCATAPGQPVIRNFFITNWTDGSGTHGNNSYVDTKMTTPPTCNFKVTKTIDPGQAPRIQFGGPAYNYTVTYKNLDTLSRTVGTVSDFVRILQPSYATALPYQYAYECNDGGTGVTGYSTANSQAPNPNNGSLAYTSQQMQGAAVISQTGVVTFAPLATLTCHVHLTIQRPAPSDPHCSNTGDLQNVALIDPQVSYNPNLGAPTNASHWAHVETPLPRCFNLQVNKEAQPLSTTTTGPGLNYTLTVTNNGDPITGLGPTTAWPVLTDTFAGGYAAGTVTATPAAGASTYDWIAAPPANPFSFGVHNLATGGSIQLTFPVAPPFQPGNVLNDADIVMSGPEAGDWYAKDPGTLTDEVSRPVTQATSVITVRKVIVNDTGKPTPTGSYLVKVDCSPNGPHTTVTLTPPNGLQQAITIPQDSVCTIQETKAPPPPTGCRWETTYPNGVKGEDEAALVVRNELKCDCPPESSIKLTKKVINETHYPTPNVPFDIKFDCTPNGPHMVVTLNAPNNLEQTLNVPVGAACAISEIAPPPPPKPCHWETTYPNGTEGVPGAALMVVNTLKCDDGGKVIVSKRIIVPPGMPTPVGPYLIKLDCLPGGPHTTVLLNSPGNLQQSVNVPASSTCTITELPPPPPPPNCYWQVTYPTGASGHTGATLTVLNTLVCAKKSEINIVKKIIVPQGVPVPTGPYMVKLDCSPFGPHIVVPLSSPFNLQRAIGIPPGASCNIFEYTPPAPPNCFWSVAYPSGTHGGAGSTLVVQNTLQCKITPVLFTVVKRIITPPGVPAPAGPYQVKVDCNPNGPHTTVTLTGPSNLVKQVGVNSGSNSCTVTELPPPPPPPGCAWIVSYPGGQTGHTNSTVIVQNALVCKDKTGSLTIDKVVENASPLIPPPATNFLVDVNCVTGGPSTTLTLNASNSFQGVVNGIANGRVCSIHEQTPPVPTALQRRGCHWDTAYPDGASVTMAGAMAMRARVINRWSCKDGGDEKPGFLTVFKKVINDSPIPPPATNFLVDVNCVVGGPNTTVTLNAAGNFQSTVNPIPAGRTCTIHEQAPPVPADLARRGCHWETSYPGGNSAGIPTGQGVKLGVENHWICKDGGGGDKPSSLTVFKRVINDSPIAPPPTNFLVDVNCVVGGPNTTVTLNAAGNFQASVNPIPAGRNCTVNEQIPPVPADLARRGCHWETSYPAGASVGIPSGQGVKLEVDNRWVCKGDGDGGKVGSLTVFKKIENLSPVPVPPTNFLVDVTCQPGGPTATLTLNAASNFQGTVNPIPAGRNCAIHEQAPPVPTAYARMGCRWETSYPNGGSASIVAGAGGQLTVLNRWLCSDKPTPGTGTVVLPNRGRPRPDIRPDPGQPDLGQPDSGPVRGGPAVTPGSPVAKPDAGSERQTKKPRVSVGLGVGSVSSGRRDKTGDAASPEKDPGSRTPGGVAANDTPPAGRAAA